MQNEENQALLKKKLRLVLKQKRKALSASVRKQSNLLIIKRIKKFIAAGAFKQVMFYYPLPEEVSLLPLLEEWVGNKAIYLPKLLSAGEMKAGRVSSLQLDEPGGLVEGAFGLREPFNAGEETLAPGTVVLTPGLGYDLSKQRLGYGKGYYDRFFQRQKGVAKVGIFFSNQQVATVPTTTHDVALDFILTEQGVF